MYSPRRMTTGRSVLIFVSMSWVLRQAPAWYTHQEPGSSTVLISHWVCRRSLTLTLLWSIFSSALLHSSLLNNFYFVTCHKTFLSENQSFTLIAPVTDLFIIHIRIQIENLFHHDSHILDLSEITNPITVSNFVESAQNDIKDTYCNVFIFKIFFHTSLNF